jgi:TolB-like protein/Tfp pilus assembly protein PilF
MNDLLRRLKDRKLVQWALAYIAAAFALIQVLDVVAQRFGWPESMERALIVALAIGFFVAVVLAWYHGEKGAQRVGGAELLILALLFAIGGGAMWRVAQSPSESSSVTTPAKANRHDANGATKSVQTAVASDKSIAVLPFANLSDDKANAYFADGMQDEILTKLAKIGALRVVSRSSTQHYASAPDNPGEIASQLGVANILEGSVQKSGNAVHINVQLIRAASDEHLWAESYNRTLDDIFGVEGEVAQAVAEALNAKLTGAERQVVSAKGTENPKAYESYLRGRALDNAQYSYAGTAQAIDNYFEAVHEDPQFALAWAAAAVAMSNMYLNHYDSSRSTPEAVRRAADTAMKLQPRLAESLLARGASLYRIERDFPAAREVYQQALAQQPGDVDILSELFFIERRMGLWNESIAHYREAIAREPRNVSIRVQGACEIFLRLRRFDETRELLEQALKIAPDDTTSRACLAMVEMQLGRLDAAQAWLERVPVDLRENYEFRARMQLLVLRRDLAGLAMFMQPAETRADAVLTGDDLVGLILLGFAQRMAGHVDIAHKIFERLAAIVAASPGVFDHVSDTGAISPLIYVGLGDWPKAHAAAQHQIDINRNDANESVSAKITLAKVLAQQGNRDAAIALLPELLEVPSGVTPALLALDPLWDPIRDDPRFVAMTKLSVAEYKVSPQ